LAIVLPCFPIWLCQNEKMPFMAKCIHFWFGKVEENDDQAWHLDKSGGLWPYSWETLGNMTITQSTLAEAVASVAQSFGLGGSCGISTAGWEQPHAGASWAGVQYLKKSEENPQIPG
jgi:hypothetical protein